MRWRRSAWLRPRRWPARPEARSHARSHADPGDATPADTRPRAAGAGVPAVAPRWAPRGGADHRRSAWRHAGAARLGLVARRLAPAGPGEALAAAADRHPGRRHRRLPR